MKELFVKVRMHIFIIGLVFSIICFLRMMPGSKSLHTTDIPPWSMSSPDGFVEISPSLHDQVVSFTPHQKIAQMITASVRISKPELQDELLILQRIQPGFVVIYGRSLSFKTMKRVSTQLQSLSLFFPVVVTVDHEGGSVQRLKGDGFLNLESWAELCQKDLEEIRRQLDISAAELHSAGVDIILGPVVDFADGASDSLATRACLGSSDFVLQRTQVFLDAFTAAGVMTTLKHFPGIASLSVDLHDAYEQVKAGDRGQEIFHALLQKNPKIAVMSAHAGLPDQNLPCSLSKKCIDLLSPYPDVLIITDDVDMAALSQSDLSQSARVDTLAQRVVIALEAGNSVVLLGPEVSLSEVEMIIHSLADEYAHNPIFANIVDQNFINILEWRAFHQK